LLNVAQPAVRLLGRIKHGLGPWSWKGFSRVAPLPTIASVWSTRWKATQSRLAELELILKEDGAPVIRGGDFDSWDLSISGGLFGTVRAVAMVEEHGDGKQLLRLRALPKAPNLITAIFLTLLGVAGLAILNHAVVTGTLLTFMGSIIGLLSYKDCALAMSQWHDAVNSYVRRDDSLRTVPRIASVAVSSQRIQFSNETVRPGRNKEITTRLFRNA
jgi:hypothetical protein